MFRSGDQSSNSMSPFSDSRGRAKSSKYIGGVKSVGRRIQNYKRISTNKMNRLVADTEHHKTENDGENHGSLMSSDVIYAMSSMSSRYLRNRAKANQNYANRDLIPYQKNDQLNCKFFSKQESKPEAKSNGIYELRKNHKSSGVVL